jgi:hypothetical protein
MAKNLDEVARLYDELKNHSTADDSTRTHELYAELALAAQVPLLEESTESEWKSLTQREWDAVQMRATKSIEQISEELNKNSSVEINPFEVEVILKDAQSRIEFHVQSLLSENQSGGFETISSGGSS